MCIWIFSFLQVNVNMQFTPSHRTLSVVFLFQRNSQEKLPLNLSVLIFMLCTVRTNVLNMLLLWNCLSVVIGNAQCSLYFLLCPIYVFILPYLFFTGLYPNSNILQPLQVALEIGTWLFFHSSVSIGTKAFDRCLPFVLVSGCMFGLKIFPPPACLFLFAPDILWEAAVAFFFPAGVHL